jgi:hypothetical protein
VTAGAARIVAINGICRYITLFGEASSAVTLKKTSLRYVQVVTETHMTAFPDETFVQAPFLLLSDVERFAASAVRLVLG